MKDGGNARTCPKHRLDYRESLRRGVDIMELQTISDVAVSLRLQSVFEEIL